LVYPIHGGGLCRESLSIEAPTEVISEQDVASFAVVPDQIVETRRVTALLHHETKIDGDPLITGCGSHRTFGAWWRFAKFGSQADRTLFDFRWHVEFRHPLDKTMHLW
jgi:hypothetical protein